VSLPINLHAKLEVCIFSRSRDIRGSQNLKFRSRDQGHAAFGQFFISWFSIPWINPHEKFGVCIFIRSRDIRGSQNLKVGHPEPGIDQPSVVT